MLCAVRSIAREFLTLICVPAGKWIGCLWWCLRVRTYVQVARCVPVYGTRTTQNVEPYLPQSQFLSLFRAHFVCYISDLLSQSTTRRTKQKKRTRKVARIQSQQQKKHHHQHHRHHQQRSAAIDAKKKAMRNAMNKMKSKSVRKRSETRAHRCLFLML